LGGKGKRREGRGLLLRRGGEEGWRKGEGRVGLAPKPKNQISPMKSSFIL